MVALAYGDGVFTALGQSGIYTSTDGVVWIMQAQLFYAPNRVAYGNGLFVAAGPAGAMFLSVGGTNIWTTIESDAAGADLNGILFSSGLFVAVGANGTVLTSTLPGVASDLRKPSSERQY